MRRAASLSLALLALSACSGGEPGPLVFAAGSLGPPIVALDSALAAAGRPLHIRLENAASLASVRKLTDLGRVPDVLTVADATLLDSLVVPRFASWYLVFGTNAMVLAYGPRSQFAAEADRVAWQELLLRPGVRTGRSDPTIDPSGYRALMALQLAERHSGVPGLAARLLEAMPARYVRPIEAELSALVQAGELDYVWTYRNLAIAHGLRWIELPPEVNLEDPALADWYASAEVTIGAAAGRPGLRLRGQPILYGLTIPAEAPRPDLAERFVAELTGPVGRAALEASGFRLLEEPYAVGKRPE